MADSNTVENNTETTPVTTGGPLSVYKNILNERIPTLLPQEQGFQVNANDDPHDGSFHYLLEKYILNPEQQAQSPEIKALAEQYNALPADIRAEVDTKRQFFSNASTNERRSEQAQAVIELSQNYLNVAENVDTTENGNLVVNSTTAKAFRDRLETLQEQGEVDVDFDPRTFDGRTVHFLNALMAKRMDDANVKPSDLNEQLMHLWAMEQSSKSGVNIEAGRNSNSALGEIASLLNLSKLMTGGDLPSGQSVQAPQVEVTWEAQWTNNDSADRFFNYDTYAALHSQKSVTTDTLFNRFGYDQEQYDLLNRIADELEIDKTPGRSLSREEVGQIAAEMLSYKAQEAWCMINPEEPFDEQKINEMIHEGKFMPHLDDLLLVTEGFGMPDDKQSWQYSPEEQFGETYAFSVLEIKTHQNQAFLDRFGDLPDSAIDKRAVVFGDSPRGDVERDIRNHYGSPAHYFSTARFLTGNNEPTDYEKARDEYLVRYQKFKEDGGSCMPMTGPNGSGNGGPQTNNPNDGLCTVESATDYTCGVNTDAVTQAPPPVVETVEAPCTVESATDYNCSANFDDAAGQDQTTSEKIETTIQETTGHEQGTCTVEEEYQSRLDAGLVAPCVK